MYQGRLQPNIRSSK